MVVSYRLFVVVLRVQPYFNVPRTCPLFVSTSADPYSSQVPGLVQTVLPFPAQIPPQMMNPHRLLV